ncbi:MAG: hypothetical protein A2998_02145 [Candidatus Staskawiczbacteria bacterium RIFCSPLOWO2_01_FULL_37_25b]|uniref:Uncharacterized protein n=2 Tax=Candidatus Staskawicziibacteriota TaxID=1817916 RepID=A0A1G2HM37_9BACT|nr:MAG: hypothetical protein A2812_00290 [Candidatus Staskawiczbacteria bacterium RIFCSPHIGHO2_01_FULL_36_16]OGZ71902.1 MAG: hypothetical protein A2998_02145 [Candidatus Staskawiczbacteria bacterium RIFCSPLOWO2_01_FULL_37_25b]
MNNIIKAILKTFIISSAVSYMTYLVVIGIVVIAGAIYYGNNNLNFNLFSSAAYIAPVLILPVILIFGFCYTLVLSAFYFLDKRFFDKYFVIISSSCFLFIMFFIIKDLLYSVIFILFSLMIYLVIMKGWIKEYDGINE